MNVLLFVMSMLMLLVMITYGRLESFRNFAFVQVQFKEYMEHNEREFINQAAIDRYQTTPATRSEKSESDKREKSKASSKLSFNLFIDKEERDANQVQLETHLNVARSLIYYLYGDQDFYKELEAKRPNFVNEIFSALMTQSETLPKIKKVKELATIDLKDPELNDAFTRMLKGAYEKPPKDQEQRPTKLQTGYYSLLDFITVGKGKLQLRVFLASRQLLMAVFGNPATVDEIVRVRYQLYRNVVNKVLDANQATEEFKTLFGNSALPFVPEDFLDFGVSKTNPNPYR